MNMVDTLKGSYFSEVLPEGWDISKIYDCVSNDPSSVESGGQNPAAGGTAACHSAWDSTTGSAVARSDRRTYSSCRTWPAPRTVQSPGKTGG